MRRKSMLLLTAFLSIASGRAPVLAAGHEEVTVIPVGRTGVERGRHEVVYRLPSGPSGPLHQPVVFIAAQPWAPVEKLPPEKGTNEPPKEHQVPGTLSFTIGDQELPDWVLRPHRTAYVVGLDVIRANRAYHAGNLAVTINLDSEAEGVNVSILGMPDPLLLDDGTASNRCGPLADYQAAAADPEVRAYFAAMIDQIAGQQANAQRGFDTLRSAKNPNVARLARRALRMLAYQLRDHKLTGNFMEHYRWALYLQFCGLFDAAFREFDECRILEPDHVESQFRAGECLDRINAGFFKHLFYMERAGEAGKVTTPNVWSTLVAIQSSGGAAELSAKNVSDIKDHWLFAEKMLWAASGGVLATSTVFHEIGQTARQPYTTYPGNVRGPADDIVEQRGWFDGVISVQPDRKGKDAPRVAVVGGDAGPNGAALSSVTPDATWPDYLEALYRQLCWAAETAEVTPGLPAAEDAVDCGQPPTPGKGHALRAAVHYHFTRSDLKGLNVAEEPRPGSYLRLWRIEGPYRIDGTAPSDAEPPHHVLDPLPAGPAERTLRINSKEPFVDLAALLPKAGWAMAQATSYVFSPKRQVVRFRIGRNDGIAVWLNGRCIREGRRYASGRFQDRNLLDTVLTAVTLDAGWNEIRCVVESWPAPRDKGWGFSVGITTLAGARVPGLANAFDPPEAGLVPRWVAPKAGRHYAWPEVKHDYRRLLPRLTESDLRAITGVPKLSLVSAIQPLQGYFAIIAPNPPDSPRYRKPPATWTTDKDRDVAVNNLMDWAREACAAFRYVKGGSAGDLLFLKPEAIEAFLTLLVEPEEAGRRFETRRPADRVLGYVVVPVGHSTRTLLVVDTLLGDKQGWPLDEEDLLSPIGPFVPNAPEPEPQEGPPRPQ